MRIVPISSLVTLNTFLDVGLVIRFWSKDLKWRKEKEIFPTSIGPIQIVCIRSVNPFELTVKLFGQSNPKVTVIRRHMLLDEDILIHAVNGHKPASFGDAVAFSVKPADNVI